MRRLLAAFAACLVLSGCATESPRAILQDRANAVVEAANAGDSAALRTAASLLLQEVNAQDARADLTGSTADALRVLINRILNNAGRLDQVEPSPAPSAAEPSPTPSPSPTRPSVEPTPEPPPPSEPPPILPSEVLGDPSPSSEPTPTSS